MSGRSRSLPSSRSRAGVSMTAAASAHRIAWWVYIDGQRVRRAAMMRGLWGYDATCSCGWETQTGGAVRSYIDREVWHHKFEGRQGASASV